MQRAKVAGGQSWQLLQDWSPPHSPSISDALHRLLQPKCAPGAALWSAPALESRALGICHTSSPDFILLILGTTVDLKMGGTKKPKKTQKSKTKKNLQRSDYFFHSNCSKAWTFSEITSLLKTIFPPCVQSKVPFLPTAYKRRLIHKLKGKLHSSQALVQRIIFSKKHLHHNCCLRPDPCRMRTQ